MLGTSKNIWGFEPRSIPNCQIWLDASDQDTMNSTTTVTVWNDKSGNSNNMTGTATLSGRTMTFNGTNQAFSNATYAFPFGAYSMFAVYSNTTAPASTAYMNAVYGAGGYPMLGVYDVNKLVSARSVVANTGALVVPGVGWATRIAGTGYDYGQGIATDSSGNVFVTGYYYNAALTLYNTGGTTGATLANAGSDDAFIAKYTSAGAVSWAARIAGTGSESGNGIATDSSGNVFVTGSYNAALTLYNTGGTTGATLAFAGGYDAFIAKYTSAGAVSWATRIAGTGNDFGYGIATDSSGNVFVTGYYNAALTLYNTGGTTGATLAFAGGYDAFIAKYTSAGAVSWATRIAGTSTDLGRGIATDSSGNVFVTGYYTDTVTLYNTGGTTGATLTNAGTTDAFIAKYTSAGAVSWAAQIGTADEAGNAIATDPSGNVFVTGFYYGALTLYNTGGTTGATLPWVGYAGTTDVFIAKYTSAGVVSWATRIASTDSESGTGIATDSSGNVFVTGYYYGALTLYNTGGTTGATLANAGGPDAFIAKYTSAGAVSWATRIAGTGNDFGNAIATDPSGNVFVTGYYSGTVTLYNTGGTTGATLTNAGTYDAFIAKYTSDGFFNNIAASTNVLVSATYTPSTFSPFVNGSNATTLAGTTLTATGLFLGGPFNYFNGSISEVLVYGSTLSIAQRQSIEGYLNKKWGITLSSVHPFFTQLPMNRTFAPTDIPGASLWLDAADPTTMNSTTTVTIWNDKSGLSNTMTGTATLSGRTMTFNGSTQAFSNTTYMFPSSNYSMFAVYSNTTAPASTAYMNAVYGAGGYPMLGVYDVNKLVSARSVVANTGALTGLPAGWAARIAGTGNDFGYGIATDSSGNVFVTGYYDTALTLYNTGGTTGPTLTNATGTYDAFIAKYTSAGAVSWATRIAGTGNDFGNAIATDSSGNVFVTGYYNAALTLYNTGGTTGATLTNATGTYDAFIAKYTSAGAVSWATRIAGTGNDFGTGIATDSSGNVFVTGYYYNAALTLYNTGGTTGATLANAGSGDVFIAKYTSAGAVSWAAQIAGTGNDSGTGIATDSSGNVFVTGYYTDTGTLYNTGGTTGATLANAGGNDVFIAKYTSAGAVSWAAQIAGTADDQGNAIATDPSGNVFVTGFYYGALTLYNTGGTTGATLANAGGGDVFIAKYTSAGVVSWAARIASTAADFGQGIATDSSGNVFVTGFYTAALILYNTGGTTGATLPWAGTAGTSDVFIAKYTSAGVVSWATRIAGGYDDRGNAIATDPSGNVFVTGYYSAALTLYNTGGTTGATLPWAGTAGTTDAFIAKYSSDGFFNNIAASTNVLVSATYTPSTFSPFVNGINAATLAGTTLAATGLFVGGPSNYFNGSISEVIIYGANLTAGQRQQVEGYLLQKWNLRSQIVAGHQYKVIPPATPQPPQYSQVTQGNWNYDWQPYLKSLAAANATGVSVTTSNLTGGATFATNGWFGGVLAQDGNIYFTPSTSANIIGLNVSTGATRNITGGATYTANGWIGGVLGPDGNIYFAPLPATNILRLNPYTGVTTNITGGAIYTLNGWAGGVLGPDGNIYFTPYGAANVLRLNPLTGVTTNITGGATYTQYGWIGAVLGPDNNIYFMPNNATNILRLNPYTGVTTNITGGATYIANGWAGGVLGPDGNIYITPYGATNIMKLTVSTGVTTNITGGATYTVNGWYGGVVGPDGNIYFTPNTAANVLRLNVSTGVTTNITGGATYTSAGWIGGVLAPDGNIYFISRAATNILKLTFTGLSQLPTSNYCLSAYANKL